MNIEEILDILDEMLDKAWNLPLTGGRCVVDAEKVRDLIEDVRLNLPTEIRQARAIVSDRAEILAVAKREAETMIQKAEDRVKIMVAQEEIVKQAQTKASEILSQAQTKSREMRQAAQEYSGDILAQTEEALQRSYNDVKTTRQALRGKGPGGSRPGK